MEDKKNLVECINQHESKIEICQCDQDESELRLFVDNFGVGSIPKWALITAVQRMELDSETTKELGPKTLGLVRELQAVQLDREEPTPFVEGDPLAPKVEPVIDHSHMADSPPCGHESVTLDPNNPEGWSYVCDDCGKRLSKKPCGHRMIVNDHSSEHPFCRNCGEEFFALRYVSFRSRFVEVEEAEGADPHTVRVTTDDVKKMEVDIPAGARVDGITVTFVTKPATEDQEQTNG